jgi:AcrR family transcriptional regulator
MSVVARSRAGELTREDVIDAAAELVAERGYAGLSMRALAQRCGVATMTLYRHVRTKEDLLGALADRVLGELELPAPDTLTWQEQLATVFRSVHDLLLAHPDLVEIAARQHVAGEAAYRGAEVVLDALRRGGIEGESAASAFATLFAFTLGFTQQQLQASGPGAGLAQRRAVLERLPVDDFENLSRLGGVFLLRHSDRHFEDGLDLIIRGLERQSGDRARRRKGGP